MKKLNLSVKERGHFVHRYERRFGEKTACSEILEYIGRKYGVNKKLECLIKMGEIILYIKNGYVVKDCDLYDLVGENVIKVNEKNYDNCEYYVFCGYRNLGYDMLYCIGKIIEEKFNEDIVDVICEIVNDDKIIDSLLK